MAGRIFINYRRDDDPSAAARVRDGLAAKFGKSAIFMDVDNLLAGQRFDDELAKALAQCDVLIAVIGPRWMEILKTRASSGDRDYVREEIAGALQKRIAVIPVRVGREGQLLPLPRAEDLPEELRDLIHYQKHDVAHERFSRDIAELGTAITVLRRARQAPRPWGKMAAGIGALVVAGMLAIALPKMTGSDPDAERQRLAQVAVDADAKREAAETEAARLRAEAEAERKVRQTAAAEQKRKDEEAMAAAAAEEKLKADEAAAANAQAKADAAQKADLKAKADADAKRLAEVRITLAAGAARRWQAAWGSEDLEISSVSTIGACRETSIAKIAETLAIKDKSQISADEVGYMEGEIQFPIFIFGSQVNISMVVRPKSRDPEISDDTRIASCSVSTRSWE